MKDGIVDNSFFMRLTTRLEEITKLITLADVLELKAGIEIWKRRFFYDLILLWNLWLGAWFKQYK